MAVDAPLSVEVTTMPVGSLVVDATVGGVDDVTAPARLPNMYVGVHGSTCSAGPRGGVYLSRGLVEGAVGCRSAS